MKQLFTKKGKLLDWTENIYIIFTSVARSSHMEQINEEFVS